MPKKIIVASKNPVKLEAVRIAFQKMFSSEEMELTGLSVPSEVQDQPMDEGTTIKGAMNRVNNARSEAGEADFWVGIEGGVEKTDGEMKAFAWVVIRSVDRIGKARTGTFFLPPRVVELVEAGRELGEADDIVFGHTNSKQKNGAVGLLTGDLINRTGLYSEAVILALIPFRNPFLYK